ncbi:uncharacterized protein LACBIDRAFT_304851 [Laccaria bicolor S238N-H82]|uniref:Predicted protein n=1 Tax=Laccaria bicolor (strain S238N-H82 / ATCC MYA-4686) TaxID=486041 RepID=B0DMH0_LACBS|nr:uncharacterized protein LACBIDRAFT_304851 [Laccaria bicolor S238N-H82]EDR04288.1 predicted protein [Laccaria bicolor S238N-H82]|eukprot:XP_001885179.1 predicted protein [Laccaria bicolor S238N-H82]
MKRQRRRKVGPVGQTSSAYATITDLPNELVEKIVEDVDDDGSIFRLSLTCKRLHFLVLPTFFSRSDLEDLQNGFFRCHDPGPNLLEALRMALFVRHLSTFTFYFTGGIEQVMSDILSLRGLLARIPPVGTIHLGLPDYIWNLDRERWGKAFLKLLESIANSGCRDLGLLNPRGYPPSYDFCDNLYVATPLSAIAKSTGAKSRGTRKSGRLRNATHPHSTGMSTIKLLSSSLFQPFFMGWIIHMLEVNQDSLVCIQLNVASIYQTGILPSILDSMNLPAVKEVEISSRFHISGVDMCSFLNRHPSINSLHLDGILPFKDPQIPDPPIILPYLTQLTALPPMLTSLLQHRNMVPLLSSVHVLLNGNHESELDLLVAVATHNHISSLQFSTVLVNDFSLAFESYIREDKSTRIITSLAHIRSVVLNKPDPVHPGKSSPLTVKRWLYLFPHLEHVTLSFRLLDDRVKLSDEERHGVVIEFATQFAADRPTMKTLSVESLPAVNLDDLRRMPGFKNTPAAGSRKSNRALHRKECSCK